MNFIHKLAIARKEANALYWLELLKSTCFITPAQAESLPTNAIEPPSPSFRAQPRHLARLVERGANEARQMPRLRSEGQADWTTLT